jgi:hypothetical protein
MKKITVGILSVTAALLSGCLVTSVAPFYTPGDLTWEPALVGAWTNPKKTGERWKFEPDGTNTYLLTLVSDDKPFLMQAHLFKLEGVSFLDLFPAEEKGEVQPPPIPSHFLFRVRQTAPSLRLALMDYDWLGKSLEKEPKALAHQWIRTRYEPDTARLVLTADTADLQQFLLKHLKTEAAWQSDFDLVKDAPTAPSALRQVK